MQKVINACVCCNIYAVIYHGQYLICSWNKWTTGSVEGWKITKNTLEKYSTIVYI